MTGSWGGWANRVLFPASCTMQAKQLHICHSRAFTVAAAVQAQRVTGGFTAVAWLAHSMDNGNLALG